MGMWGSDYKIPKAVFYLLKGTVYIYIYTHTSEDI